MKSKEALEDLKSTINALSTFLQRSSKKEYQDLKIIEKDLEILEILKKKIYLNIYDNDKKTLYIGNDVVELTNKESMLLKEWINRE